MIQSVIFGYKMVYRLKQTCPGCGKKMFPLSRNNGTEQVCPYCWDVLSADTDEEVTNMRRDFKRVEGDNGLVDEFESCVGLCTTCKHRQTCTFPGNSDNPKLFCEEFECVGASSSEGASGIGVVSSKPVETLTEAGNGEPSDEYLGLCVNCENREFCKHPRPAGGIWYCEEYR